MTAESIVLCTLVFILGLGFGAFSTKRFLRKVRNQERTELFPVTPARINVKYVSNLPGFRERTGLSAEMHNELALFVSRFIRASDGMVVLPTYEGTEIRIPVEASRYVDPEDIHSKNVFWNTGHLVSNINAALFNAVEILILRAVYQALGYDSSPLSGWYPSEMDDDDGDTRFGYTQIPWLNDHKVSQE